MRQPFVFYLFTTFIGSPLTNALRFSSTIPTSLVLVSNPAQAMWRGYQAVFASEQRITFFWRLGRENVNSRAQYPARFQRVGECLLVNHGAARGVDEKCVRLHHRNKLGVYKPGCLRSQRAVESHKVRLFKQLVGLNESDRPVAVSDFCGARIGEHIHAESPCDFATALPILP